MIFIFYNQLNRGDQIKDFNLVRAEIHLFL